MRILFMGGTGFVGRHLVESALSRGHEVSLFHRGQTGVGLFPDVDHRLGDRATDLSALQTGTWDATIDVTAYRPGEVSDLAAALHGRGGHYTFISTVDVYAYPSHPGYDEDSALVELVDPDVTVSTPETYGGLKVLCERAVGSSFGAGRLIVRPTNVVGPYDYTGQFASWVRRIARGGEVAAPGPADCPIQVIDARDLAAFTVHLIERRDNGVYHAATPAPPFAVPDLLETIRQTVGPPNTRFTWIDEAFIESYPIADRTFALWDGSNPGRLVNTADPARSLAAGLTPRPLALTVRDVLADVSTPAVPGIGLDEEAERKLLQAWHERDTGL